MLEWLKRCAWKAHIRQKRIGGSNPPLSAKDNCKRKDWNSTIPVFFVFIPIGEENESNYFVLLFAKIYKAPLAIMRVLPPMHLSAVVQLTFYQE